MKRNEKRPLKECNNIEGHKIPKQSQNVFGSDFSSKCKISCTPINENKRHIMPRKKGGNKSKLQESPNTQRKIDQYFTSPKSASSSSLENLSDISPITHEVNTNSEKTPSNEESHSTEIIFTVNKLFMEDLRCPCLTPFSLATFSCSSVTSCAFLNHKEASEQLCQKDEQILMFLVSENCWYLLLKPLNCHLTETVYFSPLLFRSLLYGITVEKHEEICLRLVDVLKTHLKFHPPCRKSMRKFYNDVLLGDIKTGDLMNTEIVKYSFNNIIKAIEETCKRITEAEQSVTNAPVKDEKDPVIPSNIDDLFSYISRKYINNDDMLSLPEFNYHRSTHDNTHNEIDSFELLKRLMYIFDVTLCILEENFRMWWMKSRYKLHDKLCSQHTSPFIAQIAWKKLELKGSINEHCIQIFMLFKNCPAIFRHHLSRYIALLFEVSRANEENKDMKFPFFSSLCYGFAEELSSHIMGVDELKDKTINLVQFIYPDWLRFRVCGVLLKSDISSGGIDDLRSIYRIILRNLKSGQSQNRPGISGRNLRSKFKLPNSKVNAKNSEGETLVHKYCRTNNLEALKKCLQYPETNVNVRDNVGWTALHNAAKYNSIGCLELLIKYRLPPTRGAEELNIFCLNSENESPLMCAVKEGNTEIVDILLKNGAGPTVWNKNSNGFTSLDLAPNEFLKNMLLNSWKYSILSFECLSMAQIEVDLLNIMLTSYCQVYHTGESCNNDWETNKQDFMFKFCYGQFFKDKKTLERLSFLIKKLSRIPSNPSNLSDVLFFINSCYS